MTKIEVFTNAGNKLEIETNGTSRTQKIAAAKEGAAKLLGAPIASLVTVTDGSSIGWSCSTGGPVAWARVI